MKTHLTFDLDWCPDWTIDEILKILDERDINATFFTTHKTILNKIIEDSGHNLGIHPNFLPNKCDKDSVSYILDELFDLAPQATCMRTHGLIQSTALLYEIFSHRNNLKYDFSLFTPGVELLQKIKWSYNGINFIRLNYQWEDDFCFYEKNYNWKTINSCYKLSILDFHPIHIALNSCNANNYRNFKSMLGYSSYSQSTKNQLMPFVNKSLGTKDTFMHVLNYFDCISFEDLLCELE